MQPDEVFEWDPRCEREFDALFAILQGNPDINSGVAAKQAVAAVEALTILQEKRKNG